MKVLEKPNQVRGGEKQTPKQILDRHLFPLQEEVNQTLFLSCYFFLYGYKSHTFSTRSFKKQCTTFQKEMAFLNI